jgi:K+-transporting ATPase KdpF subunit
MNPLYVIGALIAVALSIYLTVALLKPEWFE